MKHLLSKEEIQYYVIRSYMKITHQINVSEIARMLHEMAHAIAYDGLYAQGRCLMAL